MLKDVNAVLRVQLQKKKEEYKSLVAKRQKSQLSQRVRSSERKTAYIQCLSATKESLQVRKNSTKPTSDTSESFLNISTFDNKAKK